MTTVLKIGYITLLNNILQKRSNTSFVIEISFLLIYNLAVNYRLGEIK